MFLLPSFFCSKHLLFGCALCRLLAGTQSLPIARPDPTHRIPRILSSLGLRDALVFVCSGTAVGMNMPWILKQMGEYLENPSRFLLIFSLILHNSSIDRIQRHTCANARAYIRSLQSLSSHVLSHSLALPLVSPPSLPFLRSRRRRQL